MIKKLFLIFAVVCVLALMLTTSVSAEEENNDTSIPKDGAMNDTADNQSIQILQNQTEGVEQEANSTIQLPFPYDDQKDCVSRNCTCYTEKDYTSELGKAESIHLNKGQSNPFSMEIGTDNKVTCPYRLCKCVKAPEVETAAPTPITSNVYFYIFLASIFVILFVLILWKCFSNKDADIKLPV